MLQSPARNQCEPLEARRLLAATLLGDFDTTPADDSEVPFVETLPNGLSVFKVNEGAHEGVWATDGTAAGTRLLADVQLTNSMQRILVGDVLYFAADDGVHGYELWRTDGTAAGTRLVADLAPGPDGGSPGNYSRFGDGFLFTTRAGNVTTHLWRSDGTPGGTVLVTSQDLPIGSGPTTLGGRAYFSLHDAPLLYSTDGTGVDLFYDFGPAHGDGARVQGITVFGGRLLMIVGGTFGAVLYSSDGTVAGTRAVTQLIGPGAYTFGSVLDGGTFAYIRVFQGGVSELWRTDGTSEGTIRLHDEGLAFKGTAGGYSYFASNYPHTLWRTDGTATGMVALRSFDVSNSFDAGAAAAVIGDELYFRAGTEANGYELWKSDGTPQGTVLAIDINPGLQSSSPEALHATGGRLIFTATSPVEGLQVRTFTPGATHAPAIKHLAATRGSDPRVIDVAGGKAFFNAGAPNDGPALLSTDGTPAGTRLLNPDRALVHAHALFGGQFFFSNEGALAKSDGTTITNFTQTWPHRFQGVQYMAAPAGTLFATSTETVGGTRTGAFLYTLTSPGGTPTRTQISIPGTPVTSRDHTAPRLYVVGNDVYFRFHDLNTQKVRWFKNGAIWSSNGLWPGRGPEPTTPPAQPLATEIVVSGVRYFAFDDGVHGTELWVEDGAGARLLDDINPGPASSSPADFRAVAGRLVFAADRADVGRELWSTALLTEARPPTGKLLGRAASPVFARTADRDILDEEEQQHLL